MLMWSWLNPQVSSNTGVWRVCNLGSKSAHRESCKGTKPECGDEELSQEKRTWEPGEMFGRFITSTCTKVVQVLHPWGQRQGSTSWGKLANVQASKDHDLGNSLINQLDDRFWDICLEKWDKDICQDSGRAQNQRCHLSGEANEVEKVKPSGKAQQLFLSTEEDWQKVSEKCTWWLCGSGVSSQ